MKWFRLYSAVVHDPKVQRLHPATFKHWVNVLCIASENKERGIVPDIESVSYTLRVKPCEAENILLKLEQLGLLDRLENGVLTPHNWTERQRVADDVSTRVRRHRENKGKENEDIAEDVTLQKRTVDTDTDTDKKKKENPSYIGSDGMTYSFEEFFEKLWSVYPKKDGKKEALRHYVASVKTENDMKDIRDALSNYLHERKLNDPDGKFFKNGSTWFNNWRDFVPSPEENDTP